MPTQDCKAKNDATTPSHVVGIGASAGGLEALQELVINLEKDAGLAYVIVQHLSPDYKSLMVELLSKYTVMPILRIEDGMEIEKNKIYLISPRKNIKIANGKFISVDQVNRHKGKINLPIDILFQSMAEDVGDKAIGIVLSGTGSDGTRGIRAIKENGGMTVAQLPTTAQFTSMPENAIATELVDYILSPDAIPIQLSNYTKHPFAKHSDEPYIPETDNGLTRIFALVKERHKVDFTHYKPSTIIRRIERRITVNQCQSLQEYKAFIDSNPKEVTTLFQEMLIGVTSFFRDDEVFQLLTDVIIPDMISSRGAQRSSEEMRIWIAGCSTGEEAYSIAILLSDFISTNNLKLNIKIFATDVDARAIEKASLGIYANSIAADISPEHLTKYFVNHDDHYQINRTIRECVVFAQHDLTRDPPFTNIDLITCRNLMIYLQPILQKKVLELFNFSLRNNGVLVLGSSETVGGSEHLFETIYSKEKIFKTRGKQKLSDYSRNTNMSGSIRRYSPTISHLNSTNEHLSRISEERFFDRLMLSFSEYNVLPLTLVFDEQLVVSHIYGEAQDFLKYVSGKVILELNKIITKELSVAVTTAAQKCIKSKKSVALTNIRYRARGSHARSVDVKVIPMEGRGNQENLFVVFIREELRSSEDTLQSTNFDIGLDAEQRIADLEQELQFSRESLQATVEELETSNEELQATNEELLASNEELQSTNEELQSVNEELYTVNAEYQTKITELTTLNMDMDNLFESTHTAALFVDENGEIRRFTPRLTSIFPILQSDVGRPIDHLVMEIGNDVNCHEVVKRVIKNGRKEEYEIFTEDEKWHLLRVSPYTIRHDVHAGAVVTLLDIDELKKAQSDLVTQTNTRAYQLAHIIDTSDLGVLQYRPNGNIVFWSKGAQALYGWSEKQALSKNIFDMVLERDIALLSSRVESLRENSS